MSVTKDRLQEIMRYDEMNLRYAKFILRDVNRWGGPQCFMAVWARLVMKRLGGKS